METIARIGIDTSKGRFQLHGVDAKEQVVLRKVLRRKQFLGCLSKVEVGEIGLEACGASHHWARELPQQGHRVVLLPPQYMKPYVARGKNDKNDAEGAREPDQAAHSAQQQHPRSCGGVRSGGGQGDE